MMPQKTPNVNQWTSRRRRFYAYSMIRFVSFATAAPDTDEPKGKSRSRPYASGRFRLGTLARLGESVDLLVIRITPAPRSARELSAVATYVARCHRVGDPVPMYASEGLEVAQSEFAHHFPDFLGSKVRCTTLAGRVKLVDALRQEVLDECRTRVADLTGDDLAPCQHLAALAFSCGIDAVRLPSARHPGGTNVAVAQSAAVSLLIEVDITFRVLERP
jgi:hypothetical protein